MNFLLDDLDARRPPRRIYRNVGRADLGLSTIVDFEKESPVSEAEIRGICVALEKSGVEFIAENGRGAGVGPKKSDKSEASQPVVCPTDIKYNYALKMPWPKFNLALSQSVISDE